MLPWWIVLVVIALVSAAFGFAGLATGPAGAAELCFFIFIVVAVLLIVAKVRSRRRTSRISLRRDRGL
jgi:uncharacterized membrane protein YtjA (UPF0391 family)